MNYSLRKLPTHLYFLFQNESFINSLQSRNTQLTITADANVIILDLSYYYSNRNVRVKEKCDIEFVQTHIEGLQSIELSDKKIIEHLKNLIDKNKFRKVRLILETTVEFNCRITVEGHERLCFFNEAFISETVSKE